MVEYAHQFGVSVEASWAPWAGSRRTSAGEVQLTDPDQAEEFVERTGCDALAVAIGTSHGAYKFKAEPKLALDLDRTRSTSGSEDPAWCMHGSSSRAPGAGRRDQRSTAARSSRASACPWRASSRASRNGVRKINVDTDIRLAMTAAIRKTLAEAPEKFDPRDYLGPGRRGRLHGGGQRMEAFGSAGHAGDYTPITLEDMKAHYKRA